MAAVIFDEAADAALHRFLSFLRLLMLDHPRNGAEHYAIHLGMPSYLVSGWNAVKTAALGQGPVQYVFISPERGLTTEEYPGVPDEQIHFADEEDTIRFEGSHAWQQTMRLAELVANRQPQGVSAAWVEERIELLRQLATAPLRGEDKIVDYCIREALSQIRDAVNGPDGSLASFTEPIREVVDEFLGFHLTRTQASNIIAVLFAFYALKFPSPLDHTGGVEPVKEQIEHLISLASAISRDRHRYDLGTYCQLTYLGLLWADTALLMAKNLAKRSEGEGLVRWFEQRSRYADEFAAHYLAPALTHPMWLAPFGVIEYQRARTVGLVSPSGVYAGVGEDGNGPVDPEAAWATAQAYSAQRGTIEGSFEARESFLCPVLAEHLSAFTLTMKLGQSFG